MSFSVKTVFLLSILFLIKNTHGSFFGGGEKKILLQDVKAITLYAGKSTRGRRSTVPQLECIGGGSASCDTFRPRVVQCTNVGFDGLDVQWECKTDMDNNIRFGSIDVTCEGYDYPEDPYITAGSCGLRYNLDYTKDGHRSQHDYGYGSQQHSNYYSQDNSYSYKKKSTSGFFSGIADLIVYCAIGLMGWAFYKTCISPGGRGNVNDRSDSTTNDDYPSSGGGGYGWNLGGGANNYGNQYGNDYYGGGCGGGNAYRRGRGYGNFWAGAATGGLLGYMMGGGNRNRTGWGGGDGGYYSGGGGSWGGSSGGGGGSTGTRSASGYGGTSRR